MRKEFLRRALQSTTLFAWSVYQPDNAPPLDFITSFNLFRDLVRGIHGNEPASDAEKSWRSLLMDYDFQHVDEFDLVLLDGVKRGAFEPTALLREAAVLDKKFKHEKLDNSFSQAWALYHDLSMTMLMLFWMHFMEHSVPAWRRFRR